MSIKIPDLATRVTQQVADNFKKLYPQLQKFPTTDADGVRGVFLIPPIGKKKKGQGNYYSVLTSISEEHDILSIEVLPEKRQPSSAEVTYIRNLFFEPQDVVVQFIPSDAVRTASLGYRITLWRLKDEARSFLPSRDGIGNIK